MIRTGGTLRRVLLFCALTGRLISADHQSAADLRENLMNV
jgi:hypothetical protein